MILAEEMQNAGIRAFVGKLSMDISSRPTYVEPHAKASLKSARSFVSRCRAFTEGLVVPILTPRFVPTCSDKLLDGLGKLSEDENLWVQSHLAEAHDEIDWVRKERGAEDIDVFDKARKITRQFECILAELLMFTAAQTVDSAHDTSPLYISLANRPLPHPRT